MADSTDRLSPERLAEIRNRATAATAGPWNAVICRMEDDCGDTIVGITDPDGMFIFEADELTDSDSVFIAHARQDVPALLAEVDRLRMLLVVSARATASLLDSAAEGTVQHVAARTLTALADREQQGGAR